VTDNWPDLQRKFRVAFLRRDGSVEEFASQIPASRREVYRIAHGQVERPTHALRKAIEALVDESCHMAQSSGADSE
jgi:hypothetical protein